MAIFFMQFELFLKQNLQQTHLNNPFVKAKLKVIVQDWKELTEYYAQTSEISDLIEHFTPVNQKILIPYIEDIPLEATKIPKQLIPDFEKTDEIFDEIYLDYSGLFENS